MTYSIVAIIAIAINLIINADIIFVKSTKKFAPATKVYRLFLFALIVFFLSDILWGVFHDNHLVIPLIVDTAMFFLSMAITVFFWVRYVVLYLREKKASGIALKVIGWLILAFAITSLIINIFTPIMFDVLEDGTYKQLTFRYVFLAILLVMYFVMSVYAFIRSFRASKELSPRYIAIAFFGLIMVAAIVLQTFYPLLPFYAMGCAIGICLIHVAVTGSEKKEYREKLEASYISEKEQKDALERAKTLLYKDSLTGAQSRHAYVMKEDDIDCQITDGTIDSFAVVVFDINGLKRINDVKGHGFGDDYIKACYLEISTVYKNIPVYRFGGDEFVVLLIGDNYKVRDILLKDFEEKIDKNIKDGFVSISSGMAAYNPKTDANLRSVFIRADAQMYKRKKVLEEKGMND